MLFFFFYLFLYLESPSKRLYHAFGDILYMNTNKIKMCCYWGILRSDGTAFGYLHITLFYYFLILLIYLMIL